MSSIPKIKTAQSGMCFSNAVFYAAAAKVRFIESTQIPTCAIHEDGTILYNAEFCDRTPMPELQGVVAHELMHLILGHHRRRGSRDPRLWNIAGDICINEALIKANLKLPKEALRKPNAYSGILTCEDVYTWLQSNPPPPPPPNMVTSGCGVEDGPGGPEDAPGQGRKPLSDAQINEIQSNVIAVAKSSNVGKYADIARLVQPIKTKLSWKRVLKRGFALAGTGPKTDPTYSSPNRRNTTGGGFIRPGMRSTSCSVCVIADISGSIGEEWARVMIGHVYKLMEESGSNVYLITHTSDVCWEGWITPQNRKLAETAFKYSGGTDFHPAYEAGRKASSKPFDVCVHLTDGYGTGWPRRFARKHVVGIFGDISMDSIPAGFETIPCEK